MDIRVTSTGKIFYRVDALLAGLLLEALPASFERVELPAPAPLSSCWEYFCGLTRGQVIAVQRRRGTGETEVLPAPPEKVKELWPDCPDAVVARYAASRGDERIRLA